MRAYLQQVIYRIQSSYWFIPSLMVLAAIVLSQCIVSVDRHIGNEWVSDFWFVSMNQPDGARALLATVAGSMITVAGVTFSLTILAVSHATSHFGPRLLDNFMRDRGNQVTLGTFVATFLYCLLILRVVRGEGVAAIDSVDVFVPQLSLILALVLTIASVGELIYFIHHVPDSIHISTVLQRLASDMSTKMDELYPEMIGDRADIDDSNEVLPLERAVTVCSDENGYLQGIDVTELLEFGSEMDSRIRLLKRPGDFIRECEPIAEVGSGDEWTDQSGDRIRHAFTIGFTRTPTQDIFFILNQFVEIATRALSPGVNDPFTAMQCIDWLSVGLVKLSRRRLPSRYRTDANGQVRIITTEVSYDAFTHTMLGQLLPYVKTDKNVTDFMKQSMSGVIRISENGELNSLIERNISELDQ